MLDLQTCLIPAALALATSASAQVTGAPLPPTVLKDVPRTGYGIHLCPFPGSPSAFLDYAAEPCDHDYIMGVTGACFRRIWSRDDGGNVDLSYLEPEPKRRISEALGHERHTVPLNHTLMVDAIKQSIADRHPVLLLRVHRPTRGRAHHWLRRGRRHHLRLELLSGERRRGLLPHRGVVRQRLPGTALRDGRRRRAVPAEAHGPRDAHLLV